LDVHARSVVACGLDGETGEVLERRLTPEHRGAGLPAQRQVLGTRWPPPYTRCLRELLREED